MTSESFLKEMLSEPAPKRSGQKRPASQPPISTTSLRAREVQPLEFSKRWLWSGWSHTGSDRSKDFYVYVIGGPEGRFKIGYSNDPIRRVYELTGQHKQRMYLAAMWLHPEAARIEQRAHRLAKKYASLDWLEWFELSLGEIFSVVMRAMAQIEVDVARATAIKHLGKRDEVQRKYAASLAATERNRARRKK